MEGQPGQVADGDRLDHWIGPTQTGKQGIEGGLGGVFGDLDGQALRGSRGGEHRQVSKDVLGPQDVLAAPPHRVTQPGQFGLDVSVEQERDLGRSWGFAPEVEQDGSSGGRHRAIRCLHVGGFGDDDVDAGAAYPVG